MNRFFRRFYDIIAPIYDLFYGPRTFLVAGMRQRIVERLALKEGDGVLEVGMGTGANLPYIAGKIGKAGRIYGIDISEGMLSVCRRSMAKEGIAAELALGNAENLPYAAGAFDAVLCFGSINFYDDRPKALREMARVAKQGAKIVIGDEYFPVVGMPGAVRRLLPPGAEDVRVSMEWALVPFWIIEFRKRRAALRNV